MEAPGGRKSDVAARRRPICEHALESGPRPRFGAGMAKEAGVVMQRENEAVNLEEQLSDVGIGAQMLFGDGGTDGALERPLPGPYHRHERVADRAGTVIELDGATDVDAARIDLDRDTAQPPVEHRAQARQAARFLERRPEHLVLEAIVILANDRDLQ